MIFKRVLKLPSVKKQISSAHGAGTIVQLQTDLKLQLKRVLKCFFIFTFNNALFQFLFLSMIKIHQYCLHIPYSFKLLMPLFLSVYAELLEHLNDTLLLFHGQLWNPRMPFSVDVDFPLQQYNPTLSSDGHACLLPLVASHFHISTCTWTLYFMHKFSSLSYLYRA